VGAREPCSPVATNNGYHRWQYILLNGHTLVDGKRFTGCYIGDLQLEMSYWYKLALLIHKSLLGQLPPYLADDCQLIADSSRCTLRSSDTAMFVVRRTNSTFGDRSFAVAGARIWNSLPSSLRSADLSTERFKQTLKTFLFV